MMRSPTLSKFKVSFTPVADLRGAQGRRTPPGGPNSFNFMQFLAKFGKIVCWRPLGSCRPLLGEILDPPLHTACVSWPHLTGIWTRPSYQYALGVDLGRFPWVRSIDLRQFVWWWWLSSPWAPGHICGVSVMLVVVVVLLFLVLV